MTLQQSAQTGTYAEQVLTNEAYKLAMKTLKEAVINQWKECPVRDKEGALLLLQLAKLTDKFDGILSGLVETGKLAKHRIDIDALRDESFGRSVMRKTFNG